MNTLDVIVGGQYGSESKGRVTAEIGARRAAAGNQVIGVRVAGPNAGHVVIDEDGGRYALRQVPVTMVSVPGSVGVIAAGSEIDIDVLRAEIADLERGGHRDIADRLYIDEQATMLEETHRDAEGGNDGHIQRRIGSTGKGIGAARSDRVWRTARIAKDARTGLARCGLVLPNTAGYLRKRINGTRKVRPTSVLIEGTQGYGLGLHAGHYPQTTSSDCRAIDFLGMAGLSPWGLDASFNVWVVLRVFPIRVAGNSGPMKDETSWAELGLPEEHTTVTHKVRRVGGWDTELAREAVLANGGEWRNTDGLYAGPLNPEGVPIVKIALAMADQKYPELAGLTDWSDIPWAGDETEMTPPLGGTRAAVSEWIDRIERECGARVACIGTGPASTMWMPGYQIGQTTDREKWSAR